MELDLEKEREINMELEYNDILKASMVSFKFVAYRTPAQAVHPIPSSLFFTFDFYKNIIDGFFLYLSALLSDSEGH